MSNNNQILELNPIKIREDFPILNRMIHGKPLVYLDNAATSQKPVSVINALSFYYHDYNSNIHRGMHTLANEATEAYENTRSSVRKFINAPRHEEVIFTSGTTESINLVAKSWGRDNLSEGDEILLTEMEHHANLVPWIDLAKRTGAILIYIPIDGEGRLDLTDIDKLINSKTKIVSMTHMSNVLGTINPIKLIAQKAHDAGAIILVDGAQGAPHFSVDVQDLDIDFYAFSAHKMLGPTGVGVLYGRYDILEKMEPYNMGGEMIDKVYYDRVTWAEPPHRFEAGTPNIAGVSAFRYAIDYLNNIGMEAISRHEIEITNYALDRLSELDFIEIIGPKSAKDRGSAISFKGSEFLHPHDISQILDSEGVAVRAGHHCAQPLHRKLGIIATARASFYIYNTNEEVDALVDALKKASEFFGI
jgi:cysteine desulfurase / selenocysteine lyase